MSSSGGASVGLSRPVSRSTELLHVSHQDSAIGRRSWDSLIPDKKKGLDSPGTSGPEGVTDERTRFSVCGSPTIITGNNSPWFGASSESSRGCDTPTRLLVGGTIPRSILALSERPVTYEEELEERLGLMRVSAKTLYQRLATEKKRGKDLTHQLNARELTYRGVIEKMRSQYDQRFERLKNRARLLVTRCELLRSEKQQLEGRLVQTVEGAGRERQGMERRISSLEDEVERLRSEREEEQDLPLLRVVEDADIEVELEEERKAEEERRRAREEESVAEERKKAEEEKTLEDEREEESVAEKAEEEKTLKVEREVEGEKSKMNEDVEREKVEEDEDMKVEEEDEKVLEELLRWKTSSTGSSSNHYRILCEIAVARVAWLEDLIRSPVSGFGAKSSSVFDPIRVDLPSSLTRRSSSCPMLAPGSPRPPSNEEDPPSPMGHQDPQPDSDKSTILRPRIDFLRDGPGVTVTSDMENIIRVKAKTLGTSRPLASSQSLSPTTGHPKPARTSTATIRHSLQKLFASGKPNLYDHTSPPLTQDGKQPRVTTRIDTPSDDEPTLDLVNLDVKLKRNRQAPKKAKSGAGTFEIPMFKAKRAASLPRVELFKKLQTVGRQDRDASTPVWYADTLPANPSPLTKQERLLGVRLDHPLPEKVSPASGLTTEVQETPTTLTKQERILGVRLDRSTSDKVSSIPASTADIQETPASSQGLLTKQERVLGVRLSSDKVSPTSGVVNVTEHHLTTNFSCYVGKESTESLPDKVLNVETDDLAEVRTVKRNRSVHSTFGRLHQRRNGVTDIARVEPKQTTKPVSPLDQLGKNLKQYLH